MSELRITVGEQFTFIARLEEEEAPHTCQAFRQILPFHNKLIHARWSGEATWIPLGDFSMQVGLENHTCYPSAGQLLFYPGGQSETEILFPYGSASFASKAGQLAGNHFLTVISGHHQFKELGRTILWGGAQDIVFAAI